MTIDTRSEARRFSDAVIVAARLLKRRKPPQEVAEETGLPLPVVLKIITGRIVPNDGLPVSKSGWRAGKLSVEDILNIRMRGALGERAVKLAADYGVTRAMIYYILRGQSYRNDPGPLLDYTRPKPPRRVDKRADAR